jgi:putative DNA primase/helicase
MLGATQPDVFAEYVRRATCNGGGGDGLIQRYGLLAWPDQWGEFKNVDRYPDSKVRDTAWETFRWLDVLTAGDVGTHFDEYRKIAFLRFDDAAQEVFTDWRGSLEKQIASDDLDGALAGHFGKYRKLVPTLALVGHLADNGHGPVTKTALLRAVSFAEYLQTHAQRAYGCRGTAQTWAAKTIAGHIRKGNLQSPFTARTVHQKGWSGLTDRERVQEGLDLLLDLGWLAVEAQKTEGRPLVHYHINPKVLS